ncbi:hypothetical protein [Luteolibacter sp. Populi]|uniref:hypothetical protein n=1 Tax=Luteolibacter sp. Populi TaxID=3230487 RepID=UPI003466D972
MSYASAGKDSRISTAGTRAEYRHQDGTVEWFDNRAEGIEHGFTLAQRPPASGESVRLEFRLDGLTASAAGNGGDLLLGPADGAACLRYSGLKVFDALGNPLPASMHAEKGGISIAFNDHGASYPVTVDPLITTLEQRLDPPVPGFGAAPNEFGEAIAIDGDTALVGTPYDDIPGGDMSGSVYVFRLVAGTWTQEAWLTASDRLAVDTFGMAIAFQGDHAYIGAPGAAAGGGIMSNRGCVYHFTRSGSTWTQQQILSPATASLNGAFGRSLALSGDTLIVGAPDQESSPQTAGSAYIFERQGASWVEAAKLAPPGATAGDRCGFAVDIEGDQAVVAAPAYRNSVNSKTGSVHVFTRSGGSWSPAAKLSATAPGTGFGRALDLQGDTLLVGAPDERDYRGSAFVFTGSGGTWSAPAALTPEVEVCAAFGSAVLLDGDQALVAAPGTRFYYDKPAGEIIRFARQADVWAEAGPRIRRPDASPEDGFGFPLALHGNTLLAGMGSAFSYADYTDSGAERVLVYQFTGGDWLQQATLRPNDGGDNYYGGTAVAIDGDRCLIGVPYDEDGINNYRQGSAYLLTRINGTWEAEAAFDNEDHRIFEFGTAVSLSGTTAVIGSHDGATVYRKQGEAWELDAKLLPSRRDVDDMYGSAVAIRGSRVIVGAPFISYRSSNQQGRVFIFDRGEIGWHQTAVLQAGDGSIGNLFGSAVAVDGDRVLVGAPRVSGSVRLGQAYTFVEQDGSWQQEQQFAGVNSSDHDLFGATLALKGDAMLIGASGQNRVYTYHRSGSIWSPGQVLAAPPLSGAGFFGTSVALSGDLALIGAPADETQYSSSDPAFPGSAHVFSRENGVWGHRLELRSGNTTGNGFGLSVALDGAFALVGAPYEDAVTSPVGNITPNQGSAWFFILSSEHELFLQTFDTNGDNSLSAQEWRAVYPAAPKKELSFALVDADASNSISREELQAARGNRKLTKTLNLWLDRAAAFIELDLDKDGLMTRTEITPMWKPGARAKAIDATWKRMGGAAGLTLAQWVKARILPSLPAYAVAKEIRASRRSAFGEKDFDQNGRLSRSEFGFFFKEGTASKKVNVAWRAATATPRKEDPPADIGLGPFIEAPSLPRF